MRIAEQTEHDISNLYIYPSNFWIRIKYQKFSVVHVDKIILKVKHRSFYMDEWMDAYIYCNLIVGCVCVCWCCVFKSVPYIFTFSLILFE